MADRREDAMSLDPGAAWDDAAPAWDTFVENGDDYYRTEVHGPALLAACEPVAGRRVLDLGCGQGWFSRQLGRRGAQVVGIDISAAQIAHARRHETIDPLGITFQQLDAARIGTRWPPASFDLVTACLVLHDLPDATAVLAGARDVLVPAGRFVFSILHPFTDVPSHAWEPDESGQSGGLTIDRYFDLGPRLVHWDMPRLTAFWDSPSWHRTLTEWSALIAEAGLRIRRLSEPRPTPEQVARFPQFEPATRLPYFLICDLARE
ncbi:MAG TPA: class I SAM-dependent methyltransferase [Thermomicrobiales bacterium]|nr:class I SAM-dependent methyltransferase [Thermomicrobiales bacterium]